MMRREIIDEAKWSVLYHGPNNILEYGDEIFDNFIPPSSHRYKYKEKILAEAIIQAKRVFNFLGYSAPN